MYDFSDLKPTTKEMAILIIGVVLFLAVVFSAGYYVGISNVHDNGSGTEPIGQQLTEAGTNITNATAGISEAQVHADQVGAGIADAQGQAEYIHNTATTSAELIGQSQSIIERIRSRGKKDAPKN